MRLEACEQMLGEGRAKFLSSVNYQKFDLAIGHFHDFCPVAMAHAAGVPRVLFPKSKNLWNIGQQVSVLLLNGERFLDFPRPLPTFILNLGSLASKQQKFGKKIILDPDIESIYSKKESKGGYLL
uniref:Glucuronosyltransferase n=1 Tax=Meloidogyne hapla TaxID=6305 RepID=A0A1I8BU62_MELHA